MDLREASPKTGKPVKQIKVVSSGKKEVSKLTQEKHDWNIELNLGEDDEGEPEGFDDFEKKEIQQTNNGK